MNSGLVRAPEFDGAAGWLNTDRPIQLKDLKGKVVLLDFWTYCCINCMHVIPDLNKLERKYPNELVVIGVHSAKFDNERESENIKNAVLRYGIKHPVVNDAKFAIWQAYTVNAWPTLVLIDPDGKIVEQVSGEGNLEELDSTIAGLISRFSKAGRIDSKPIKFASQKDSEKLTVLDFPGKIAADEPSGRLFVSDSGHNRILVLSQKGDLLSIIGSGTAGASDGDFSHASFNHPQGLVFRNGSLFVADTENHLIRRIQLESNKVSTIAGTGKQAAFRAGGGPALATALSSPWDLVFIGDRLFIAMAGNHQIWTLSSDGSKVEPFAGSGREDIIDGPLSSAALAQPSGITTDGVKLYFADSEVSAVRAATIGGAGEVKTIIGQGLFEFGDKDGVAGEARLQHPLGILSRQGKLYVADSYNHKIKVISPDSRKSDTLSGDGKPGSADGLHARFSEPGGLTAIGDDLYIADTNNHSIRVLNLKAKSVSTLPIRMPNSLKRPAVVETKGASLIQSGPKANIQMSKLHTVKAGSRGKLILDVEFPPAFHLNSEGPLKYKVTRLEGKAVNIDARQMARTVHPPRLPLSIPFTAGPDKSTGEIQLDADVYYCSSGANQVCKVKAVSIVDRIKTSAASSNQVLTNKVVISGKD